MRTLLKKNKEEIILCVIFLFFALGFNIYRVQGDGLISYRFLERLLHIAHPENPVQEVVKAYFFQSGCAFFNAPFYLIAYAIERMFNISINFNGITLRQIAVNLASNFYVMMSIVLVVKILKKMKFRSIMLPVSSILFSTAAFASAVVIPSFNHSVDIFITTLFIFLFIRNADLSPVKSLWLGMVYVIAILIRNANFVFIIPIITYYLNTRNYVKLKFFIIGFLLTAWIIPALLYCYNGTFSPFYHTRYHTALVTKSMSVMNEIYLAPKNILKPLIHPLHGLFVWSPVTLLSLLGLVHFPKSKAKLSYVFIGIWVLFSLFYGVLMNEWHAGWSFSNRYFVNLFPIYIIGLAAFLEKYGKKMKWLIVFLFSYSIILYFNWHLCIFNAEFETPWNMVKAWIKGESNSFVGEKVSLKVVLKTAWEWCRYKYLFRIFR